MKIRTILRDNGGESGDWPHRHPYELFLQLEDIEHTAPRRSGGPSPPRDGIAMCQWGGRPKRPSGPGSPRK